MAHAYNRFGFTSKGLTYIFTVFSVLAYSILFDWIYFALQADTNKIRCHFPLILFPVFFSPIILFLQYYFNKIIIFDDNDSL
jgi:hypothetical protein